MNIVHVGSTQINVELYIRRWLHLTTVIEKTVKVKIQNLKINWIYHVGYVSLTDIIYTENHVSCYFPIDVISSFDAQVNFEEKLVKFGHILHRLRAPTDVVCPLS